MASGSALEIRFRRIAANASPRARCKSSHDQGCDQGAGSGGYTTFQMIKINEGARLLSSAGTIEGTSIAVGVTPRTISLWRSGSKLPSQGARRRLQEAFGIHPETWDRRQPQAPHEAPTSPPPPADDGAPE